MARGRLALVLILAAPGLAAAQGAPQLTLGQALHQAERHASSCPRQNETSPRSDSLPERASGAPWWR
jgi:hypothetical protein